MLTVPVQSPPMIVMNNPRLLIKRTCLSGCPSCGAPDRVYAETDHGVVSHCWECGDASHLDGCPQQCDHGRVH